MQTVLSLLCAYRLCISCCLHADCAVCVVCIQTVYFVLFACRLCCLCCVQYFSRSGREVTVEALDSRLQRVLGQRLEMSFYDVKLANLAYCSGTYLPRPASLCWLCRHRVCVTGCPTWAT